MSSETLHQNYFIGTQLQTKTCKNALQKLITQTNQRSVGEPVAKQSVAQMGFKSPKTQRRIAREQEDQSAIFSDTSDVTYSFRVEPFQAIDVHLNEFTKKFIITHSCS